MFFEAENIIKSFENKKILDNISFKVNEGELVSLIGPSGVGKTTLLKIIANIEKADSGKIKYGKDDLKNNPVILVFQDYVLFPNLSVFENIAFGLRARKINKDEIKRSVAEILEYIQLSDKSKQYPNQLSAGQKQRVAIARAMVVNPSVLLLDEPFANLDKNLKSETAEFIRMTQRKFNITTVCVTHDLSEAFMMSDKIGVMLEGKLCQFDEVDKIYFNPASYEVAKFLGHVNVIPKKYFEALGVDRNVPGEKQYIYARAESFRLIKDANGIGVVQEVCFAGHYILYRIKVDELIFNIYGINEKIDAGDRVDLKLLKFIETKE
jgi:putative spermidine/putrescine transport system ATP-binding protein